MPADLEPPTLARLVDFAERPRTGGWSLRAALVRYAQPEPQRVNDLLDLVRRLDSALSGSSAVLQRDGDAVWAVLAGGGKPADERQAQVVNLLRVAKELDTLGDVLAEWAVDISRARPNTEVDDVIDEVGAQLEALGVPHEERPPNRQRGV